MVLEIEDKDRMSIEYIFNDYFKGQFNISKEYKIE
jgi:hypothetical protein